MTVRSKAIIRSTAGNDDPTEIRIFKRPNNDGVTRAVYSSDDAPDDNPLHDPECIEWEHADILVKLITAKNLDDFDLIRNSQRKSQ